MMSVPDHREKTTCCCCSPHWGNSEKDALLEPLLKNDHKLPAAQKKPIQEEPRALDSNEHKPPVAQKKPIQEELRALDSKDDSNSVQSATSEQVVLSPPAKQENKTPQTDHKRGRSSLDVSPQSVATEEIAVTKGEVSKFELSFEDDF